MSSIVFLLAAVVLSVIGSAVFVLRHRKPTSLEHGIDSFSREMDALSPGRLTDTPRRRSGPPPTAPPSSADERGR